MSLLNVKISPCQDCNTGQLRRILKYDHSGPILRLRPFRRQRRGANQVSALSELHVGERGILESLDLPESVQNHLMHMGFVPGSCVHTLRRAPAGDPTIYCVDGMEIALRRETAGAIHIRLCTGATATATPTEEAPDLAEAAR